MIIELNGPAGVGKLTIGRQLAEQIGGRLIDSHTLYNPAFATTDFGTPAFFETVRSVRDIVFARARELPPTIPIILTVAPARNADWAAEWQAAIRSLADARTATLVGVHLTCDTDQWERRVATPSRALLHKLVDPAMLSDGHERPVRLDHCDSWFILDTTNLSPDQAAISIADRI